MVSLTRIRTSLRILPILWSWKLNVPPDCEASITYFCIAERSSATEGSCGGTGSKEASVPGSCGAACRAPCGGTLDPGLTTVEFGLFPRGETAEFPEAPEASSLPVLTCGADSAEDSVPPCIEGCPLPDIKTLRMR